MYVRVHRALSYEDLSMRMTSGELLAAWLPPALFVELERTVGVQAVAAAERCGGAGYYAAFFTPMDSDITSLDRVPGHSVGWVDPGSAAGYIFPRLQLAAHGIDPTTAFQEEVFFRSHDAVVRAVVDRAVDLGATFVHLDSAEHRKIVRAGWLPGPPDVDASGVQWLDPFGPLPPDVIATSRSVPQPLVERVAMAFLQIDKVEQVRLAAQEQFGTGRFVGVDPRAYDVIRRAMDLAEGNGVEVADTSRPSLLV
jgi:ABC-type phosphate/phosphonate transport system substrate-binding protein